MMLASQSYRLALRQNDGGLMPTTTTRGLPARLWSHVETAEFLQIPPATLHQLNSKKTGPRSYKVGRHRRYDPNDVQAWLKTRASDAD
jgi:predicted DNA-binding transcriptional regulator AlpA